MCNNAIKFSHVHEPDILVNEQPVRPHDDYHDSELYHLLISSLSIQEDWPYQSKSPREQQ